MASLENRAKWAKVKRGSAKVIAETTRRIERFGFVGLTVRKAGLRALHVSEEAAWSTKPSDERRS